MEHYATPAAGAAPMYGNLSGNFSGNGDVFAVQQQAAQQAAQQQVWQQQQALAAAQAGNLRASSQQQALLPPSSAHIVSAGIFGMIVAGTGAMGAHLHKVQAGEMSFGDALSQSLLRGAAAGIATAAASAASNSLTRGGLLGLGVTLATATGVSYLISKY